MDEMGFRVLGEDLFSQDITVRKRLGKAGSPGGTVLADWHVDGDVAASGSGRTLEAAFKTLAEAQAAMSAGDSLWIEPLAGNLPYREMLTLTSLTGSSVLSTGIVTNGVVTVQGAKIDCRDVLANVGFSKTAGRTNVYEIAVTFDTTSLTSPMIKVWEGGTVLTLAASLAACDGAAGTYFVAAHNASPQTVYVHPTGSTNPTTDGKVYEFNKRHHAISARASNSLTISGVQTYANLNGDGSLTIGDSFTLTNVVCHEGTKHNLLYQEGGTLTDVLALNAYWYSTGGTMFVYNKGTATGLGITHLRCYATSNDGRGGNLEGFHGHTNTSGNFGAVGYTSCVTAGCVNGFEGNNAALTFISCTTNAQFGFSVSNNGTPGNAYNIVGGSSTIGSAGRAVLNNIDNAVINISGNFTITHTTGGGIMIHLQGKASPALTINGLVVDGVAGNTYAIYHTGTGGTINVQNGDFTELFEVYHTNLNSAAITSDYNRFRQAGLDFTVQGTGYANVAAWQVTGQDANSTVG